MLRGADQLDRFRALLAIYEDGAGAKNSWDKTDGRIACTHDNELHRRRCGNIHLRVPYGRSIPVKHAQSTRQPHSPTQNLVRSALRTSFFFAHASEKIDFPAAPVASGAARSDGHPATLPRAGGGPSGGGVGRPPRVSLRVGGATRLSRPLADETDIAHPVKANRPPGRESFCA